MEVTPVLEVSGAKEGGAELTVCERPLLDRLCDSALPRPNEPVQPVNGGVCRSRGSRFRSRPEFLCASPGDNRCGCRVDTQLVVRIVHYLGQLLRLQEDVSSGNRHWKHEDSLTWILQGRSFRLSNVYEETYYRSGSLILSCHSLHDLLSPLTLRKASGQVVNKPGSRGSPLVDLRKVRTRLHRPEGGRQAEVAPTSQTTTAVAPRCC